MSGADDDMYNHIVRMMENLQSVDGDSKVDGRDDDNLLIWSSGWSLSDISNMSSYDAFLCCDTYNNVIYSSVVVKENCENCTKVWPDNVLLCKYIFHVMLHTITKECTMFVFNIDYVM